MAVINFIWDEVSDNVLLETDDSDTVTAAYVNRPEQFGELLSQDRSGAKSFFHYDGESSTSALTDENEDITDTFIYTAYGEEVARTGTTTNPFGYKGAVGYYTDESTSDIYVRNRTYEPTIGRWLSKDRAEFIDGTSLYQAYFVPNSSDPSGMLKVIPRAPICVGCGLAGVKWDITVNLRARENLVIQRICFTQTVTECVKDGFGCCQQIMPPKTCHVCYFEQLLDVSADGSTSTIDKWLIPKYVRSFAGQGCGIVGSAIVFSDVRTFDSTAITLPKGQNWFEEDWHMGEGHVDCGANFRDIIATDYFVPVSGTRAPKWWNRHNSRAISWLFHVWDCCDGTNSSFMLYGTTLPKALHYKTCSDDPDPRW
jgi:RHS repeat-associated protein